MSNNVGPINIIPDNNQVVLLDNNKSITVVDNNCCTNVDVTQPITSVVQVLTGPIGLAGINGTNGSSTPFSYVSGTTWNTTSSIEITGSFTISGSNTFKNIGPAQFTGSVNITGSSTLNGFNMLTSNDNILSSSYAVSSSMSQNANTASYYGGSVVSASYALTASYALNSDGTTINTSSFATTGSNVFLGNQIITGSLNISGSTIQQGSLTATSFTGSLLGTATTASYVLQAVSASYATLAQTSNTASYVLQAVSSSFTTTASYYGGSVVSASYAATASYALQALSASYSSTSSYLNTLNQDLTFNGNLTLNGTASITYLNVAYESSSIIYSSGSNQLGDATNDVQTLIGRTIISGSLEVTGSANIPSITGSLLGTASQAVSSSFSTTASYVTLAQSASNAVTSVTGTTPIVSSGGATPSISIPAATTSVDGYLTSTDWSTFNAKTTEAYVDAAFVSKNAQYYLIQQTQGHLTAAFVANTYFRSDTSANGWNQTVSQLGAIMYLNPTDYPTVNGVTTKLRISATISTNNTAPGCSFTFGLYPITRNGGGPATITWTIGTVISGSQPAQFVTPALNTLTNKQGTDFAIPAAGMYAIGVITSATTAVNSYTNMNAILQYRNA